MFNKMKDLMEMKKQADRIKKDLDAEIVTIEDVRGIKIEINGSQFIKSVEIDESIVSAGNKAKLQQDLTRSFNAAIQKSQKIAAQKMSALMPGLGGF